LAKAAIVNTCPFIPIDNNEEDSAYATLLLHTPWPQQGEEHIVPEGSTAVETLRHLIESDQLPTYVKPMLNKQATSFAITANQGVQTTTHNDDHNSDSESEPDEYDNADTLLQYTAEENLLW
jgi:hypothetical protein